MAVALPNFAEFDVHSDGAVDTRWKKWLARFRNLLLALDVDNAKRQRALLLHYWKQEMYRFLRNFRATPHTTTRVPPATALFGRAMRTKLPEFNEGQEEPTLEANDRNAKMKMKNYADAKTYVRPSTIKKGDTVFVRRDDSKRKRDTPYRPEPYVVISRNGDSQ